MVSFARIENGRVVERAEFESVDGRFHPSLIWVECPASVVVGDIFDGASFHPSPRWTDLATGKSDQIVAINALRNKKETEGFAYLGQLFQSDERSVQRITNAALTASGAISTGQPFSVDWAAADNTTVTLDAAAMLAMQAALTQRAAELHYYGRSIKAQVEAATTVAELAAIDIESGWPT